MSSSLQPPGLHVAYQASLSMEFSSQESWSSCHFILQGIFPSRDGTWVSWVSCIGRQISTAPPGKPVIHHGALLNQPCLHLGAPQQRHGPTDQMQAILTWLSWPRNSPSAYPRLFQNCRELWSLSTQSFPCPSPFTGGRPVSQSVLPAYSRSLSINIWERMSHNWAIQLYTCVSFKYYLL